ncbi:MAG: lysine--tRNA ligase [Candidatus Saelkia tenebricola]|nr:lysine--tRNA ligase [Candidatus Saelkia tenebricola]
MKDEFREHKLEKLNKLREKGVNPYPYRYLPHEAISSCIDNWKDRRGVKIAGRVMAFREHGKSIFFDIKDSSGRIQVYIKQDIIGEDEFLMFKECIDIGDILGVEGETFKTRTEEPTVLAKTYKVLSKSLLPLPEKWHGLKDVETRHRKRYLDLIMNENVKEIFVLRSKITNLIRKFLGDKGFIEVETPMLHNVAGGAAGAPFATHLEAYDLDLYLRIAPELYLKRLLVGGFEKVYEINRSFRNEGVSTRHNPEFTMLELYWAYADYEDIMKLTEELFTYLAYEIKGSTELEYQGKKINLASPWERLSFTDILGKKNLTIDVLREIMESKLGKKLDKLSRSQTLKLCEDYIENQLGNEPIFVTDHLKDISPLAKSKKENSDLVERFELFISGMEIANAYSELNDPIEQKKRFQAQTGEEKEHVDLDFVEALEYGMPPAGGLGIGIDRLVMLFADASSIREVLLFPLLKPEVCDEI